MSKTVASFSQRQREILSGLQRGFSNKEIAVELGIAVPTVKTHLQLLFARMGARSRSHLVFIMLNGR